MRFWRKERIGIELTIIGATNVVYFCTSVKVCRERPMCRSLRFRWGVVPFNRTGYIRNVAGVVPFKHMGSIRASGGH